MFAQVGINTTSPDAQLDVRATNQAAPSSTDGLLIPKVDAFPAINPGAAQQSMLVYLTTASGGKSPGFYYWDNATTSWVGISGRTGWELNGNADTSPDTNFIGTTDDQGLAVRTNNIERIRIDNAGLTGIGTSSPKSKLHVTGSPVGIAPNVNSTFVVENNPFAYFNILSSSETAMIFGTGTDATSGAITYNNPGLLNGMSFRTNGNITRVNLAANGNLGLGPFVPLFPLQFQNTLGEKICLYDSGPTQYGFGVQNSVLQIHSSYSGSDIAFGWGTSAALNENMRIKGNGNVGIGTQTPLSKLHVSSGATGMTPNAASLATIEGTSNIYYQAMSNGETGLLFGTGGVSTNGGIIYNSGALTDGLTFRTGGNISRMNISSTGNVALGAFVPQYPLHFPSTNGDKITLWGGAGAHTGFGIQTNLLQIYTGGAADDIAFGYGESTSFTETMRIKNSGRIGIGTNAPNAKLQIDASSQSAPANTDGIILPKIDSFPAVTPGSAQNGMMVFLTTASSGNQPGFYYWDATSTSWKGVGTSSGWSLNGNSGTSAAANFIGTTDNTDVIFKRNNVRAGILGATATGLGASALAVNTAAGSTAVGTNAMLSNTWGQYNSAFGTDALRSNVSGWYNTASGYNALYNNKASYNTAMGVNALLANSLGESNTAIGFQALRDNTEGDHNTVMGWSAMAQNQLGEQNTAIGSGAMYGNSAGTHNVAVGMNSLASNSGGISNTALGTGAMYWHTGGDNNTALGMEAMNNQTSGSNNIAIGKGANVPSLIGSDQLSIGNVVYGTGMASVATAKIGIADSAPDAKLEITASNAAAPANTDGILIPRVNAFPGANPTAAQNGMMIYLTTQVGGYPAGFYYWENASVSWLGVGSKTSWSTFGNAGTNPATSYIGTTDSQPIAFRTNGAERMRVTPTGDVGIKTSAPTAELEVNGFTKLGGSAAPAIKHLKLTGTTSSIQGNQTAIAHGISSSKILSISILIEYVAGASVPPQYMASAGYEYDFYVSSTSVVVWPKNGNSANILSKPIRILVTYEE